MSVADHHVVPGKKLWTWGNGPRGRMWDKILTDEDGPYIELMVGAYSDNQPDYSWLQPFEAKTFDMHWYPFRDIGGVKNANLQAAVNLEVSKEGTARVGFYTTEAHRSAVATLKAGDRVLVQEKISISPAKSYVKQVALPAGVKEQDLRATLVVDGKELVAYTPVQLKSEPMPKAVEPPAAPEKIQTNEELYLTGLRIEQFHNASLDPDPYWLEALKRDPGDVRVNLALGINYLKRARYADAEKLIRKSLERLTDRYTSPKDGEAFYYLGLALRGQGKVDEAFTTLYKATWSAAWRDPAYFGLAELACRRGELSAALELVDRALDANALNIRALTLKAALLRHLDRKKEALAVLDTAQQRVDPLDVRVMAERWLLTGKRDAAKVLQITFKEHPATVVETAAEYANAGLWQDGDDVLWQLVSTAPDKTKVTPMVWYYRGYFAQKLGRGAAAAECYRLAAQTPPEGLFPFQAEAIDVLQAAMAANPKDARAPYHLGNLLYDWQPEAAVKLWEQSAALDASFSIVHRNLALAFSHQDKPDSLGKAIAALERAASAARPYAVHFFELDQLYETAGANPEKRLALLEKNQGVVLQRDDAAARAVSLKVFMGKYDQAIELMKGREFNIWEGGARFNIVDCWTDALLLRGQQRLAARQFREALADFQSSLQFPENLRAERKDSAASRQPEVSYWLGMAHAALGELDKAKQAWTQAAAEMPGGRRGGRGISEQSVQRYYQALALRKLDQNDRAQAIFADLVTAGTNALKDESSAGADFFSSFGERQSRRSRTAMAHYVAGLGYLGQNDIAKARQEFTQALQASPDHLGAKTALMSFASRE
jgi:tetratricopeptide (TPR) repeat protein